MKRISAVLFVVVLWIVAVNAQGKSDREQDRLFGSVQTVRTEVSEVTTTKDRKSVQGPRMPVQTIEYDKHGNRTKRIDYNRDGSVAQTIIYNYDAEGRSTGYEDYVAGLGTPRKHIYVMDRNGNRTEYKMIQPDGYAGDEKYLYKYDSNGNRITEELYNKSRLISRSENTYDDHGKLISQVIYNPDKTISARIHNSFAPNGKPLERTRHDTDLVTYRVRYTYDDKGRLVELQTAGSFVDADFSSEDYPAGKVVYIYKGKDHPKESVTYNQDGSFRERFVNEYDSRGNWKKRTRRVQLQTARKEEPVQFEYRTITYY